MASQETFTLYRKADIEGYLDKVNTGITSKLLSGKSRMWCELYGTVLYIFRDSKRNSVGSLQVDMTQVHMVRKTTAEKSGVQFEILSRNKQHTFCASSVNECDNWIRRLQAAMTQKPQAAMTQKPLEMASVPSSAKAAGDYETIMVLPEEEAGAPRIKVGASSSTDPGYSEVEFQSPAAVSQTGVAASADACQAVEAVGDGGYAVVKFRNSQGARDPGAGPVQDSTDPSLQTSSSPPADQPLIGEDSHGYSTVELRKKSLTEPSQPRETSAGGQAQSQEKDSYVYATVQRKAVPGTDSGRSQDTASTSADRAAEGSSDEDEMLISTAQMKPGPIPRFPHPLQPEDVEPLAALQQFLSSNSKLCRPSFSDRTVTENPVDDMKRFLEELRL